MPFVVQASSRACGACPMNSNDELNHDRRLWRAVVIQALVDATGGKPNVRQEAIDWFTKPNCQFNQVCELADLDPDRVRKQATEAIAANRRPYRLNRTRKADQQ